MPQLPTCEGETPGGAAPSTNRARASVTSEAVAAASPQPHADSADHGDQGDNGNAGHAAAAPREPRAGWLRGGLQIVAKLAYPAVILCAWHWDDPRVDGCLLFLLIWLQRVGGSGTVAASLRRLSAVDWCVAALLNVASVAIVVTNSELLLRLYPSMVNLGLLIAFGATLVRGPSMIEKFARIRMPDPPPQVIRYTRRVTQIWCVFFVLNGAFSVYTALYWPREGWSLYNGAIAYGLIGALLLGEIAWRHLVMLPRAARAAR